MIYIVHIQQQLESVQQLHKLLNFQVADVAGIKNIFAETDGVTDVLYSLENDIGILGKGTGNLASNGVRPYIDGG